MRCRFRFLALFRGERNIQEFFFFFFLFLFLFSVLCLAALKL